MAIELLLLSGRERLFKVKRRSVLHDEVSFCIKFISPLVFDLLWCNGHLLTNLPLIERKKVLSEIIPTNDIIKINESFDDGIALFDTAKKLGLEGIFA